MEQPADQDARWRLPGDCEDLARLPSGVDIDVGSAKEAIRGLRERHRRFLAQAPGSILLVIQGPDTSGKNSLLRHLARGLDPAAFHVWSFGPPAGAELDHDFLWRTRSVLPVPGAISALNRSYYEAVLAERLWPVRQPRVEPDWAARHRAINDFELHLSESGTRVIKCWLHLSDAEHRARLAQRIEDPRKQWKFDAADLRNFRGREQYRALASEALRVTNTATAPWYLIPADRREPARAIVAGILGRALEEMAPRYPACDVDVVRQFRQELDGD